jgi:hypothetical protein
MIYRRLGYYLNLDGQLFRGNYSDLVVMVDYIFELAKKQRDRNYEFDGVTDRNLNLVR